MYYHCYLFIRESTCFTQHQNSSVGIHSSYRTIAFGVSYRLFGTVVFVLDWLFGTVVQQQPSTTVPNNQSCCHIECRPSCQPVVDRMFMDTPTSIIDRKKFLMHRALDENSTRDRSLTSPHQRLMIFAVRSFQFSTADLTFELFC